MLTAQNHLKQADPVLAAIIDRVGPFQMQYREANFEMLVRSIVYQQLSGKAAGTIYGRLKDALGVAGVAPDAILDLKPKDMRDLGLSRQKTEYLRDLSKRAQSGKVNFDQLGDLSDDEVIKHLTQVKGVGVWTVQMLLMFALRRPDVLPTGDQGIKTAVKRAYGLEEAPAPAELEEIARKWSPWRSVACWYLWRSLDGAAAL